MEVTRLEIQKWLRARPARELEPSTTFPPDTCKYISHAPGLVWGSQLCLAVCYFLWKWKSFSCVQLFATPWLYSPWNFPGQNTGVSSRSLQEICLTQGSNPGLLHCRWILYQLSYQGSPRILEWVADPFSNGSSQPRNQLGSPALQADSLLAELPGKPYDQGQIKEKSHRGIWLGTGLPIIHQQQSGTEIGRNREIPQAHLVTQPESLVSFKGLEEIQDFEKFFSRWVPAKLCPVSSHWAWWSTAHIYTYTHTHRN